MLNRKINTLVISLIIGVIAIPAAINGKLTGSEVHTVVAAPMPSPVDKPPYSAHRGVAVGMTVEEVRAKLGTPKEKMDAQDFFVFSDHETAQVYYGPAKSVTGMMVTYTGKLDTAPTARAVFGEDAPAKPDGGIFKMVRYPKAGFWISYNKISGDDPLIVIAFQKM